MTRRHVRSSSGVRQFERLVIEVLLPRSALHKALRATDPRVPLSTHEERCWEEAAVARCLRRGAFAIQSVRGTDEAP